MNLDDFYMDTAKRISEKSYAVRSKVGAIIVTESGAMFPGFNGTLSGFPNVCEIELDDGRLITDEEITVHAEQNALYKMLREGISAKGSTLYVTLSPCAQCLKMMISAGVKRVVYSEKYRIDSHLHIAEKAGIELCRI